MIPFLHSHIKSNRRGQFRTSETVGRPVLPVELLEHIIGFIAPDSTQPLRALSLVNSMFRILSQKILFAHIDFDFLTGKTPKDLFIRFLFLLRKSPHIALLVTSLEFGWGLGSGHKQLANILPRLPMIKHLGLAIDSAISSWSTYPKDVKNALGIHTLSHITSF